MHKFQSHLEELVKNYRAHWQEANFNSEDIETYGLNEFIGGKADAFEDCLALLRIYIESSDFNALD